VSIKLILNIPNRTNKEIKPVLRDYNGKISENARLLK
jgi:hypothetical protein